jgi:50S ribosomal protein L16 3-hydroxylase
MMLANGELGAFWDAFVRVHWEQQPAVFHGLFSEPMLSPGQAFDHTIAACIRVREGQRTPLRFFVENTLVQSNLDKYLPVQDDGRFDNYAERIAPVLRGQGFGLVVNGFSRYDFPLFLRVKRFLRGLYERVGMPGEASDLDIFVGNYRHTPFGIHTDTASNFSIVFQGRKRFLLWPGPALQDRRDMIHSVDFDDVRDQALVLEARAGDVVYWPSSYWHIAESDGSLSGVLNIALYLGDHSQRFVDLATSVQTQPLEPMLPWDPKLSRGATLPEPFERAIRAGHVQRRCEEDERRALLRAWLGRTTAYNFRSVPPVSLHRPLDENDRVQVDVEFPIAAVSHGERLLCAANGHVIEIPMAPRLCGLIERLNGGQAFAVRELVEHGAGAARMGELAIDIREGDVALFLENLSAMRAVHTIYE